MIHQSHVWVLGILQVGKINLLTAQRREQHIMLMVLCWMPYGVVALLASPLPAMLAKFSTVVNPVIYVFFNSQFNACFVAFIKCSHPPRGFTTQQSSRPNHCTSFSRLSHNAPVFRSTLHTSMPPYSCQSPEFTSYCVPQKEKEPMHDLVVHYTP
ncbi:unnamed protein product [Lota lota]